MGHQDIYAATLESASRMGLWVIPRDECIGLLALAYVFGGANEQWVMDGRLRAATLYAQRMLRVEGGEMPEADDIRILKRRVSECAPNGILRPPANPLPAWAIEMAAKYGVALR